MDLEMGEKATLGGWGVEMKGEGLGGRERKSTFALNNKLRLLLTLLRIHRLTTTQLSIETIHENVSLQLWLSTTRNSALAE